MGGYSVQLPRNCPVDPARSTLPVTGAGAASREVMTATADPRPGGTGKGAATRRRLSVLAVVRAVSRSVAGVAWTSGIGMACGGVAGRATSPGYTPATSPRPSR